MLSYNKFLSQKEVFMNNDPNYNTNEPQMFINAQYIKDLSFENPNPVANLSIDTTPKVSVNIDIGVKAIQENSYEVSLTVNSSASVEDNTLFIVELEYAGIFTLVNTPEEQREFILLVNCPNLLFPFARRIIADATRDGGYQPLMINPVDFYSLYHQKKQSQEDENTIN
ncbi:Protein-export protein SecB [Rickettsiales bacterium Ac37b]|nr:Protein-export protein SecB [Rickettsiales bacterium Ac37b]